MLPTIDPHGLVPVWERLLVADVGRNPLRMLMRRFANKFYIGKQKRTSTTASRKARAQPLCFVKHYITNHSLALQVGICDDWASLHTIGVCHVRLSQTTKTYCLSKDTYHHQAVQWPGRACLTTPQEPIASHIVATLFSTYKT